MSITQHLALRLDSYDEWLGVNHLLKRTEENIQKQKELKEKLSAEKNTKLGRPSHEKAKSPPGWTFPLFLTLQFFCSRNGNHIVEIKI